MTKYRCFILVLMYIEYVLILIYNIVKKSIKNLLREDGQPYERKNERKNNRKKRKN